MSSESFSGESEVVSIPDRVPIFPLPNVVFFPHTYLPLHIFEPRYREMVRDSAANENCIGMALLKDGWEDDYDQAPPIFDLGCVGRITSLQTLPDGRMNILLQGLCRCLYQEEKVSTSYRQAQISLLYGKPREDLDQPVRSKLMEVAEAYLRSKKADDLCRLIASGKLHDPVLVNNLSAGLDLTASEKQFLLESDHLNQQARRLIDLLRFKLHQLHFSTPD